MEELKRQLSSPGVAAIRFISLHSQQVLPYSADKEQNGRCCFHVREKDVFLYLMTNDDQPMPDGREAGGMGEKGEWITKYKLPVIKTVAGMDVKHSTGNIINNIVITMLVPGGY